MTQEDMTWCNLVVLAVICILLAVYWIVHRKEG